MNPVLRYILNNLIAFDVGINTVLAGSPYETISSRMWRKRETKFGGFMVKLINKIFSWLGHDNHCEEVALPEYAHKQDGEELDVWK